jgi:hypothetical protein
VSRCRAKSFAKYETPRTSPGKHRPVRLTSFFHPAVRRRWLPLEPLQGANGHRGVKTPKHPDDRGDPRRISGPCSLQCLAVAGPPRAHAERRGAGWNLAQFLGRGVSRRGDDRTVICRCGGAHRDDFIQRAGRMGGCVLPSINRGS